MIGTGWRLQPTSALREVAILITVLCSAALTSPLALAHATAAMAAGLTADPSSAAVLTLAEAESLAIERSPRFRASGWRVRAAGAVREDAGRRPNPSLQGSVENIAGSLGSDAAEFTVSAAQTLELGGKRRARFDAAGAELTWAEAERDLTRLELLEEVDERFLEAWETTQKLALLREAELVGERAVHETAIRYRSGAGPAADSARAEVELYRVAAEQRRVQTSAVAARRSLAAIWGASETSIDSLWLAAPALDTIPTPETVRALLAFHPERSAAAAELTLREAEVRGARAARVPDLDLNAGLRHLREFPAGTGLVAEISLTLPLWSQGRGLIRAMEAEAAASRALAQDVDARLEARLWNAADRLATSWALYLDSRDRLLPRSHEALREIELGYRAGRFSYLDLLDASRTYLEARIEFVEQGRQTWSAIRDLERLAGSRLGQIGGER